MISAIITIVSVFILYTLFLLFRAVSEKPCCSIIITASSPGEIAELLASAKDSKSGSVYIVTSIYDEKYFNYLKKHYFIKEVLTIVDRDN